MSYLFIYLFINEIDVSTSAYKVIHIHIFIFRDLFMWNKVFPLTSFFSYFRRLSAKIKERQVCLVLFAE